MIAQRGTRDKLEKYFDTTRPLKITLQIHGKATYDFCCFGVDSDNKLSNDRYMIFYNQLRSPKDEIVGSQSPSEMTFTVKLDALPQTIQKLVFTGSIDGAGTMGEISAHKIFIGDKISADFGSKDFQQEKAITSLEIYRKDGWRFNVVARGFNGGLDALLAFYGGEQIDEGQGSESGVSNNSTLQTPNSKLNQGQGSESAVRENSSPQPAKSSAKSRSPFRIPPPNQSAAPPNSQPASSSAKSRAPFKIPPPSQSTTNTADTSAPKKISLEKKISEGAPKLISLVKPLKVELEKRNLLDVKARVALVVDMSGSMNRSYRDGTVQEIVNKILPVAVQFDDDGELDFWFYGRTCTRRPTVNMSNYEQAVPPDWKTVQAELGAGNNEPVVMQEVMNVFATSTVPAYIVFITDGGVARAGTIKKLLIEASYLPIFWQFVGVRGSGYGILQDLDSLDKRYVDNADFFALDDFKTVPNEELYSRLLNEFPAWLKSIKINGVLDGSAKRQRSSERDLDHLVGYFFRL